MYKLIGRTSRKTYLFDKINDRIGGGGYGDIYRIREDYSICVKIYKTKHKTHESKIAFMVANKPFNKSTNKIFSDILVWPIEAVETQNGKFVGFIMPKIVDSVDLTAINTDKIRIDILRKYPWLKTYTRSYEGAYRVRILLSHNIAIGLNLLHNTGKYVMVDCKPENIRLTPNGKIYLIDMDGIQVVNGNRVLHHAMASTEEIMPPEAFQNNIIPSKSMINSNWDVFSFATIAYSIIMARPPFTGTLIDSAIPSASVTNVNSIVFLVKNKYFPMGRYNYLFKPKSIKQLHSIFNSIAPSIKKLFLQTFEENNRPNMQEWVNQLRSVYDKLPQKNPTAKPNTKLTNASKVSTQKPIKKKNNQSKSNTKTNYTFKTNTITKNGKTINKEYFINGNQVSQYEFEKLKTAMYDNMYPTSAGPQSV